MAAHCRSVFMTFSRFGLFTHRVAASVRCSAARSRGLHSRAGGVQESEEEYKCVERLIPPSRIPSPPKHTGSAPSGWTPPPETPPPLPYMIRRSRMHNVPVYSDVKHGNQKSTVVRKVEGDIWALDEDVKEFLQQLTGRETATQVNEVTGTIRVKGAFDKELKDWLIKRGF